MLGPTIKMPEGWQTHAGHEVAGVRMYEPILSPLQHDQLWPGIFPVSYGEWLYTDDKPEVLDEFRYQLAAISEGGCPWCKRRLEPAGRIAHCLRCRRPVHLADPRFDPGDFVLHGNLIIRESAYTYRLAGYPVTAFGYCPTCSTWWGCNEVGVLKLPSCPKERRVL